MRRRVSVGRILMLLVILAGGPLAGQSTSTEFWTKVGFTGDPSPSGGTWQGLQAFQNASLSSGGSIVFFGASANPSHGAIYQGVPGALDIIVAIGQMMPGLGNPFTSLTSSVPITDDSGRVLFANVWGLWLHDGTELARLIENTDPYPGTPTGEIAGFTESTYGFAGSPRLTEDGSIGLRVLVDPDAPATIVPALLSGSVGSSVFTPVVQKDLAIPTAPAGMDWSPADVGSFWIAAGQQVALRLRLQGIGIDQNNSVTVWAGPAGGLVLVAQMGQAIPDSAGLGPPRDFGNFDPDVRINDAGGVAMRTEVLGGLPGGEAIVAGPADQPNLVALSGLVAPGAPTGTSFAFGNGGVFSPALIDGSGRLAFLGMVNDPAPDGAHDEFGLWVGPPDSLELVLYGGAQAPGLPPGVLVQRIPGPYPLSMNNLAQVASLVNLVGAGVDAANDKALYVTSPTQDPILVAREGDVVSISGVDRTIDLIIFDGLRGPEDGGPRLLADTGELVFVARFTDGTEGLFLFDSLAASPGPKFLRGDCNSDALYDLGDAIFTLNYLFLSGTQPGCAPACDSNADGGIDTADPIYTLSRLFTSGPPPPPPHPECGVDPLGQVQCPTSACNAPP